MIGELVSGKEMMLVEKDVVEGFDAKLNWANHEPAPCHIRKAEHCLIRI